MLVLLDRERLESALVHVPKAYVMPMFLPPSEKGRRKAINLPPGRGIIGFRLRR
jgi:hypothetical protein